MGLESGFKGKINQIHWDVVNKTQVFFGSNDGLFSYLNHKGERFRFRQIDVAEVFDRDVLPLYRATKIHKVKIKALCIDQFREELLLADNRG